MFLRSLIFLGGYIVASCSLEASQTIEYILDKETIYSKGIFNFHHEDEDLFTGPYRPSKSPTQSVLVYPNKLSELPYETVLKRLVPGQDGRTLVTNTTHWPYLCHAQVSMDFSGIEYGGSGIMVGPHHLLTAGHNVYDHKTKNWVNNISVHPGLNDLIAPLGEIKATRVYTFKDWVEKQDPDYDIALIVLAQSVGYETGWSGLLSLNDPNLSKEKVHITGYPGDKGFKQMWTMSHTIKTFSSERFYYEIDTFGGQSGSGVWINKWGSPYVLGVHTQGEGELYKGNSGVRLSKSKFESVINEWISPTLTLVQKIGPNIKKNNNTNIQEIKFSLNGVNQYAEIPEIFYTPFAVGYGPFTVEAWIKTTANKDNQCIVRFGQASTHSDAVIAICGGDAIFGSYSIGWSGSSRLSLSDGKWHHIAYIRNGDLQTVYVDGIKTAHDNKYNPNITSGYLRIGYNTPGPGQAADNSYFSGSIKEVRFWNVARSNDEITQFFSTSLPTPQPHLVGYWNFEKIKQNTVSDMSGNNLDLTLRGFGD